MFDDEEFDDEMENNEDFDNSMVPAKQDMIGDVLSNGGSGFTAVNVIVQDSNGDYYAIAEAPIIKDTYDRNFAPYYAHISKVSGKVTVDLSIHSTKSMNTFEKYNPDFLQHILQAKKYIETTALPDNEMKRLKQQATLISIDEINYTFTKSFTEPLIKTMFGMEAKQEDASSIVDNLLASLDNFGSGGGVAVAGGTDEAENDDALELDIQIDPLKDLIDQFGKDGVEEVEDGPDTISKALINNTITSNPIVKCFNIFREAIETENIKTSLKIEKDLLASLEYLLSVNLDELPNVTQQIIKTLCNKIWGNAELNAMFDKCEFLMKKERHIYSENEESYDDVDFLYLDGGEAKITKFLCNNEELLEELQFNRENYNLLHRTVKMHDEAFRPQEFIPFLCLSIQLSHLLNKNMLKREKEQEKRTQILQDKPEYGNYYNAELSEIIQDFIDYSHLAKESFITIYKDTLTSYVSKPEK